ncbi:uncharacterized protein A4U43_C06F6630 [Asparagus officinalis]|uniref:Uncharacterized protein n=2 Tax=Asparagus officinalis TaxID=4686 RepID=A0A5P1EP51_ASPOF|nr:uncharacterized protein A4U43_C06F6630 [Asparagus officinalis]
MRRKAGMMNPISLEVTSDNESIVEDEEPCSQDDPNWPDGDDGDREYLDVAAINNIVPTVQKGKGKGIGIAAKVVGIKDYADLEDANIVLEEDDLVVLG